MCENLTIPDPQKNFKDEFDNRIGRLTKSKAYLDFCEEVYGYRIYLFNMMDSEQLDFLFHSTSISADDTLLDLGCGNGSILNSLVEKYGCSGIGIDQIHPDFMQKSNNAITYINGDVDRLFEYHLSPTVTLSVDSLYFCKDLNVLLRYLCGLPNNRVYLFYSQYLFDENAVDRSILQRNHTKIAEILNQIGVSYEAIDYSENERRLYEKSLTALKKREEAFTREGNSDLFLSKLNEDLLGKQLYEAGRASRFLYIV
ncbi:MAG: methionine biosynthesis protein MetW [Christensenella sp.]|nr:methionine biosynthesis protein MetW [Christensenella sp.]